MRSLCVPAPPSPGPRSGLHLPPAPRSPRRLQEFPQGALVPPTERPPRAKTTSAGQDLRDPPASAHAPLSHLGKTPLPHLLRKGTQGHPSTLASWIAGPHDSGILNYNWKVSQLTTCLSWLANKPLLFSCLPPPPALALGDHDYPCLAIYTHAHPCMHACALLRDDIYAFIIV